MINFQGGKKAYESSIYAKVIGSGWAYFLGGCILCETTVYKLHMLEDTAFVNYREMGLIVRLCLAL